MYIYIQQIPTLYVFVLRLSLSHCPASRQPCSTTYTCQSIAWKAIASHLKAPTGCFTQALNDNCQPLSATYLWKFHNGHDWKRTHILICVCIYIHIGIKHQKISISKLQYISLFELSPKGLRADLTFFYHHFVLCHLGLLDRLALWIDATSFLQNKQGPRVLRFLSSHQIL